MIKRILLACIAVVLLAVPLTASAQNEFDPEGGVSYLIASLPGYPDPIIITILSGGDVDASTVSAGCVGNIFYVPDVEIELTESVPTLRAYFTAMHAGDDTTMVVQKPDGTFVCNDDAAGDNPMVEIQAPATGTYRFWVGTYGSTNNYPGYVVITTGASMPGALVSEVLGAGGGGSNVPVVQSTATPAGVVDPLAQFAPTLTAAAATVNAALNNVGDVGPTLTAAAATVSAATGNTGINFQNVFGNTGATPEPGVNGNIIVGPNGLITATIGGGFTPDPLTQALTVGGAIDTRTGFGPDCRGFINATPSFNINYTGGGSLLRIFFASSGDTTLIIQKPDGSYACNDDFVGTLSPLVDIANPTAGIYTVWVGTYTQNETQDGNLFITANPNLNPTNS